MAENGLVVVDLSRLRRRSLAGYQLKAGNKFKAPRKLQIPDAIEIVLPHDSIASLS